MQSDTKLYLFLWGVVTLILSALFYLSKLGAALQLGIWIAGFTEKSWFYFFLCSQSILLFSILTSKLKIFAFLFSLPLIGTIITKFIYYIFLGFIYSFGNNVFSFLLLNLVLSTAYGLLFCKLLAAKNCWGYIIIAGLTLGPISYQFAILTKHL